MKGPARSMCGGCYVRAAVVIHWCAPATASNCSRRSRRRDCPGRHRMCRCAGHGGLRCSAATLPRRGSRTRHTVIAQAT
jgi:hypothetical protein